MSIKGAFLLSRFYSCHQTRKQQAHDHVMSLNDLQQRTPPDSSLGLGFYSRHVSGLGSPNVFMSHEEIMGWINSVSSFLQDRYDHCLSKPENQHHLQTVLGNIDAFIKDMHEAAQEQHKLAREDNKIVYCPSHSLLLAKGSGLLGFRHYTAATVCLIARYGIRGGPFANRDDEGAWHLAATMLLVSVIVDLKHGNHFAPQFKKNAQAMADEQARKKADSVIAALAQQLHELTMRSDNGFRPEDEQMEAMRLGLSSINFAQ
jgi:hypothetical protein